MLGRHPGSAPPPTRRLALVYVSSMSSAGKLAMSYAEYLVFERTSATKVEFADGVAYAMAEGTPEHAQLAMQLGAVLVGLVRPGRGRCRVYSSDAKIHVVATGSSYYPDLSVVCGDIVPASVDPAAITNPVMVVEVLSASTESYDRRKKFADYLRIPSLDHYLLASQESARLEHYRRNGDGTWTLTIAEAGGVIRLPELGGDVVLDEVYLGVPGLSG